MAKKRHYRSNSYDDSRSEYRENRNDEYRNGSAENFGHSDDRNPMGYRAHGDVNAGRNVPSEPHRNGIKKDSDYDLEGYAGMETRDRNQYRSGEYVSESRNGYADMPQQVEYRRYKETPYGLDQYLDDGIGGIDNQVRDDRDQVRKGLRPQKY